MTDVYGVGPIVAAFLIGYSGDIGRFDHHLNEGSVEQFNSVNCPGDVPLLSGVQEFVAHLDQAYSADDPHV